VVVGARLFEVLFYNPSYYLANPWKVFAVWEGGLSFHGGLVGGFLAGSLYVRRKGIRPLAMADMLMPAVALANALGRIGNFINGELPGKLTTLPWGVQFPGYEGFRHPTQLYEAAYDLVIAAVLLILWRKKLPDGRMVGWFLVLYAVLRFAVEFLKDIPLYGPLTLGQWFNIPLFAVGVWLLLRKSG
jgi:phosphatidylglycerol:prolipoprotein diacylglycerol transferase